MVQLPRDRGLCVRCCGPAFASSQQREAHGHVAPKWQAAELFGAGTNCGSATDKITACSLGSPEDRLRKEQRKTPVISCCYLLQSTTPYSVFSSVMTFERI